MTKLLYSENWATGTGGWSVEASRAAKPCGIPQRIHVGHPLAEHAIMFPGNGGWAIAAPNPPVAEGTLQIVTWAYILKAGRNSLSLNVRTTAGDPIFKFSFGEGGYIWANKQSETKDAGPQATSLRYEVKRPYALIATHTIGSGVFTLKLMDLLAGGVQYDATEWNTRCSVAPGRLDYDQEGGSSTAYLGKCEVYQI